MEKFEATTECGNSQARLRVLKMCLSSVMESVLFLSFLFRSLSRRGQRFAGTYGPRVRVQHLVVIEDIFLFFHSFLLVFLPFLLILLIQNTYKVRVWAKYMCNIQGRQSWSMVSLVFQALGHVLHTWTLMDKGEGRQEHPRHEMKWEIFQRMPITVSDSGSCSSRFGPNGIPLMH